MIRKVVAVIFALLSLAFLFRFVQYGYKWVSGAVQGDTNFKALTIWSLVYVIVCAGIAFAVSKLSGEEVDESSS
jgi:TRAP-type C4-dicarboxylate transport system permease small subunit